MMCVMSCHVMSDVAWRVIVDGAGICRSGCSNVQVHNKHQLEEDASLSMTFCSCVVFVVVLFQSPTHCLCSHLGDD